MSSSNIDVSIPLDPSLSPERPDPLIDGRDDRAPVLPPQVQGDKMYVLPLSRFSPNKKPCFGVEGAPLESPDMKFARNRLGDLLSSMRTGEKELHGSDKRESEEEDKRGPGRPKKVRKERRVVFELRGKPFGLRDMGIEETIFSLCRIWMRGKEEGDNTPDEPPQPSAEDLRDEALDLLATKDIHHLPVALDPLHPVPPPLRAERRDEVLRPEEYMDGEGFLLCRDYADHWKNIKQDWRHYAKERAERHHRSIHLLETVYNIAQQNQHF